MTERAGRESRPLMPHLSYEHSRRKYLQRGFWPAAQPDLRAVGHQLECGQEDDARTPHQAALAQPESQFVRRSTVTICLGLTGEKEEIVHLIDVVSTNKTDFFREPEHFEFLVAEGHPGPGGAQRERAALVDLERRLLDRRGALHPGDGAEGVCRGPSRFSLQGAGHRYLHHRAGARPSAESSAAK